MRLQNRRLRTLIGLSVLALLASCAGAETYPITIAGEQLLVEVVDTDEARAQGLMHRDELGERNGMLFVFPSSEPRSFWMKNTLIPLDMIFADVTGTVRRVHHMARPHSEKLIPGGSGIKYVLEINGGLAEQLGIGEGSQLRHPAIEAAKAAWAC